MKYQLNIKNFELLTDTAIQLSCTTTGKLIETWEEQIASDFFCRICTISHSILKIIPESKIFKSINSLEVWDYSSICILTRALIDTYLLFFHYCIDIPVNLDERAFKQIYWNYFIDFKRVNNLELLKTKHDISKDKELLSKDLVIIKNNSFYNSLEKATRNKIDKCQIFQLPSNSVIALQSGINEDLYKSFYDYLSRYTHSDSYCLDQLSEFVADSECAKQLIDTILSVLCVYLSFSIRDFLIICPELTTDIDSSIIEMINDSERKVRFED